MLILSKSLLARPILSLRTGGNIGMAEEPIINPKNLKIAGWYSHDHFSKDEKVLLEQEVREVIPQGMVVNDYEALTDPEDLVRLKDILELRYDLIGKPVFSNGRKIGKVTDYATDNQSMMIQKLYVAQPLHKSISGGELSIDRSQIIELTVKKIVVKSPEEKNKVSALDKIRSRRIEPGYSSANTSLTNE